MWNCLGLLFKVPKKSKKNLIDALPDDLLLQIFNKLPVQAIGRCMCVNKRCHSLIKSPSFVSSYAAGNRYFIRWKNYSRLQFHAPNLYACKTYQVPLNQFYDFCSENCITICNGVILLAKDESNFILLNPTINKMLTLPHPNVMPNRPPTFRMRLGFAFDSRTNDYKVFRILQYGNGIESHIEIFSMNRNSWKFGCRIDHNYLLMKQSPASSNGVIHWVADEVYMETKTRIILGFDINAEFFRHIKLPTKVLETMEDIFDIRLAVYKDSSLALVTTGSAYEIKDDIEVWVMKEYSNTESWTNIYRFRVYWPELFYLTSLRTCKDIGVGGADYSRWLEFPSLNHKVIGYIMADKNMERANFKKLGISQILRPFEESLVLLDNDNAEVVVSYAKRYWWKCLL